MRQRHEVEAHPGAATLKTLSDHLHQRCDGKKLGDGELAHGDHQIGLEELQFRIQPAAALGDLGRRWHAVSPLGILSRKTAADGGHIDAGAEIRFPYATLFGEPAKERFPGGPRKRAAENRLLDSRSLADKQHLAHHRRAGNDRFVHGGTAGAGMEGFHMRFEPGGRFHKSCVPTAMEWPNKKS